MIYLIEIPAPPVSLYRHSLGRQRPEGCASRHYVIAIFAVDTFISRVLHFTSVHTHSSVSKKLE